MSSILSDTSGLNNPDTHPYQSLIEQLFSHPEFSREFISATTKIILKSGSLSLFCSFCDALNTQFPGDAKNVNPYEYAYSSTAQILGFSNTHNFLKDLLTEKKLDAGGLIDLFQKYPYLQPQPSDLEHWFEWLDNSSLEGREKLFSLDWSDIEPYPFLKSFKQVYEALLQGTPITAQELEAYQKIPEHFDTWRKSQSYTSIHTAEYRAVHNLREKIDSFSDIVRHRFLSNPHPQTFDIISKGLFFSEDLGCEDYFQNIKYFSEEKTIQTVKALLKNSDIFSYVETLDQPHREEFSLLFYGLLGALENSDWVEIKVQKAGVANYEDWAPNGVMAAEYLINSYNKNTAQETHCKWLAEAVFYLYYAFDFTLPEINQYFKLVETNFKCSFSLKDKNNQNPDYQFLDCYFEEVVPRLNLTDNPQHNSAAKTRLEELNILYQKMKLEETLTSSPNTAPIKPAFKL